MTTDNSGHGGRRPGSGRPPHQDSLERLTFYIGESQVIWLEEYTSKWGHTSLSTSLREILYSLMIQDALDK